MLLSQEKLKELANSPYRIVPREPRKRSTGKNLHPQLTLRVDPELVKEVKEKMQKTKNALRENGILLSYLQNLNTLTRYLFDEYLEGKYDHIADYPKVMLPTDCGQIAVRYPETQITALKEKANASGHTYVSVTTWLFKEWLKED